MERNRVLWVIFSISLFLVVVLAYNREPSTFHFLGKNPTLPLCVWLLIAFAVGAAVGFVAAYRLSRKKR